MKLTELSSFPENGILLICNFKKGETANQVFDYMRLNKMNRGSFIVTGPFNRYAWQKAHDFCNNVINYLQKAAKYYKGTTEEYIENIQNVDLLISDNTSINNAVDTVTTYHSRMKPSGKIIVRLPELYHTEFKSKVLSIIPRLKIESEGNYSYIKVNIPKKVNNSKVVRERSIEMT